jgi:hypothetical protein
VIGRLTPNDAVGHHDQLVVGVDDPPKPTTVTPGDDDQVLVVGLRSA